MKRKLIYPAFALTVLAAGCNNGEDAAPPYSRAIEITTDIGTLTRATDQAFETGDCITVYAYESGDVSQMVVRGVTNTLQSDGSWTAATPMKWKDDATDHDFLGIYPVKGSIADFTATPVTLGDDAAANDLLIATATGRRAAGGPVPLTFNHVMSRVSVQLTFSENLGTAPTVEKVVLKSRKTGSVNYLSGAVTSSDVVGDMAMTLSGTNAYRAVTLPQTLTAGEAMIVITIGNRDYTFAYTADIPLEAGRHRTISLTVNGTAPENLSVTLGNITINDWGDSETIEGGEAVNNESNN